VRRLLKLSVPRKIALVAAAIIVLAVTFSIGFATGDNVAKPVATLQLKGTAAAPHAKATLDVLSEVSGNWPMNLHVSGLPQVTPPEYYVVWLVRSGKPWAPCGSFVVSKPTRSLTLQLNAPYTLKPGDTWIVTRQNYGRHSTRTTVLEPKPVRA
jgi:hypothetical protein